MTLRLHNTLSGTKDVFEPLEAGHVRMYTCGPTVWNFAHVGNLRAFLFYDLVRRHLRVSGFRVTHVMNLTDIDDRILDQAMHAGTTIEEYVEPYARSFFEDMATVRAQPAEHYPRATEHIPEMVDMISTLIKNENAYIADGDVYFRIASFPGYGSLSHLDRAGLKAGARVATDKDEKESVSDFALWKKSQPEDEKIGASWEAPFGLGRPGWHIECSAMSKRYLGETLDIHAGGVDLLFPHHENEIAQSEAANRKPFVRVWLHSEHLFDATGEKMSKSAGGFTTLRDAIAALDSGRVGPHNKTSLLALIDDVDAHLDVIRAEEPGLAEEVERLIAEREAARAARDFARADRIRVDLRSRGIALEDSRDGV